MQEVWARLGLSMTQTFTWQFTRRVADDGTVGTDVALTPLSRTLTLSSIGQKGGQVKLTVRAGTAQRTAGQLLNVSLLYLPACVCV